MHRNIQPAIIEINTLAPVEIVISGFGAATDAQQCTGKVGPSLYCAPEIWTDGIYTKAADIWALAVLGLKISGVIPSNKEGEFLMCDGQYVMDYVREIDEARKDLPPKYAVALEPMLEYDARRRASARVCLQNKVWAAPHFATAYNSLAGHKITLNAPLGT